jgi:hypothetical protein
VANNDIGRLGKFLSEVANWTWEDFVLAEKDPAYTSNQAVIFALIRSCASEKMDAIRIALNRLDGKLKTPIIIETPKIYYQFPNATLPEDAPKVEGMNMDPPGGPEIPISGEVLAPPKVEKSESDLPSMTLRETLMEMANYPRSLPEGIIKLAEQTDAWLRRGTPRPDEIPKVKSVVAAHLLAMANNRNLDALTEVFDQIDGKLAETIKLIGDDLYITSYLNEAPPGAYINADGVVEIEADIAQKMWAEKLGNARLK